MDVRETMFLGVASGRRGHAARLLCRALGVVVVRLGSEAELAEARALLAEPPVVRRALLAAERRRLRGDRGRPDDGLPRLTPEQAEAARRGEDVEP